MRRNSVARTPELRGSLDSVEPDGRVFGWCWSPEQPRIRRRITLLLDGQPTLSVRADMPRDDLLAAGIGDGGHGIMVEIPRELRRSGTVTLRDTATGWTVGERSVTWPPEAPAPLCGNVDLISRDGWVSGWCRDPDDPGRRLTLDVLVDDIVAGTARATEARHDLHHAAVGDGRYGFSVMLPYDMLAERDTVGIRVVEHGTGRPLGETTKLRVGRKARLPDPAIARHGAGYALVVDAQFPVPDRDAGSVAVLEQMLVLHRLGWRVIFAAATGAASVRRIDRRRLERAGIEVAPPDSSVTDLLRERGADLGLVHLHRHRVAALLLPRIHILAPRARVIFSPADLHFLREAREAALHGHTGDTAAETRDQELTCIREADATILHSDHEHRLLAAEPGPERLHLLRWIVRPVAVVPSFEARGGLLFIANFRHAPNVDAMLWYAREVLPILQRLRPGLILDVIGADAPPAIRALDGPDIQVRGWIEALAPRLAAARLTIAPLRYGAGFKGKVATSLAACVPVVGTSIAVEGTGLADGDGVAVADSAEAFAIAITHLHDDATAWRAASAQARERVVALYSPAAADNVFRALLAGLGLPTAAP